MSFKVKRNHLMVFFVFSMGIIIFYYKRLDINLNSSYMIVPTQPANVRVEDNKENMLKEQEKNNDRKKNDETKVNMRPPIKDYEPEVKKSPIIYDRPRNIKYGVNNIMKEKHCDNWIVVTSIFKPSDDIKYLRDSTFDWCMVVVGDKKSPKKYIYKDIVFLSVEKQIEMAKTYPFIDKIDWYAYQRKMVGYLYAMSHGAKTIYETDDDNAPLDGLFGFKYTKFNGLTPDCDSTFFNPFAYFGQPSVWPRGYPLKEITESTKCSNYSLYSSDKVPLIQQAVVNGDPDVDAIYRLTRKNYKKSLNIKFDENAPPLVLKKTQYSPFNSQSTLVLYDAFWSLVFPVKYHLRECDIIRSYVTTRLLREIDGQVAYMPPNAFQFRNAHSYYQDFKDEDHIYMIPELIKALDEWKCTSNEFKECFIDLVRHLTVAKIFGEYQIEFYKSWINDIDKMNYKWPKLERNKQAAVIKPNKVVYHSVEQDHSSNSNQNEKSLRTTNKLEARINHIQNKCSIKISKINPCQFNNIVLITEANSNEDLNYIDRLVNIYFPYIIVCTKDSVNITNEQFFTIIVENDFEKCVQLGKNMGFKPKSFIIAKAIKNFQFWQTSEIVKKYAPKDYSDKIIFLRRNVANGYALVSLSYSTSDPDLCEVYSSGNENQVCDNLNKAISALNWHNNDLTSESCMDIDPKTIWIPDLHDGDRVDMSSTLVHMGHDPILTGFKGLRSPFPESIKLAKNYQRYSQYIRTVNSIAIPSVDESLFKENFEFYKDDPFFAKADAIVCAFPSSLCEGFIALNQSLIFNPLHRYNINRCSFPLWQKVNRNYDILESKSKLYPAGMSLYDQEYQYHFTGYKRYRLWTYSRFYMKNIIYKGNNSTILVGPSNRGKHPLVQKLNDMKKGVEFATIRTVYPRYTMQQLANHRAILVLPYAVCTYSLTEFYAANIPLFFPSIKLLHEHNLLADRIIQSNYCIRLAVETPLNTTISTHHPFNPNSNEFNDFSHWVQYAEFYTWPHVTVFDSFEELPALIKSADLKKISDKMKSHNRIREADLLNNWCDITKTLKKSPIPKSYQDALNYFGVKNF